MKKLTAEVAQLFEGRAPVVESIYRRLLEVLAGLGPYEVEPKKKSIHLVNGSAFGGVHPRASSLLLNLRMSRALVGPRIRKAEQVSKNRWHNEIVVSSAAEIDAEVQGWLAEAYQLSAS